jgi:hypothetical protein
MLLFVIAGFLLALGLQLRARPFAPEAGYYLGADGVVSLTSWKVIEPRASRGEAWRGEASPAGPASPARPWGEPPPDARAVAQPGSPLMARMREPPSPAASAALPAAAPPPRPPEPIVVPAEMLAEIEAAFPAPWAKPRRPEPEFDAPPFDPAFAVLARASPHSLALH